MDRRCSEKDAAFNMRENSVIERCTEIGGLPGKGGAYPSLEGYQPKLEDLPSGMLCEWSAHRKEVKRGDRTAGTTLRTCIWNQSLGECSGLVL